MDVVCLSVSPDPKSRTEGHTKLKIGGRKPLSWVTMTPFRCKRSKVKVTKCCDQKSGTGRPMNIRLDIEMEYRDLHHRHVR